MTIAKNSAGNWICLQLSRSFDGDVAQLYMIFLSLVHPSLGIGRGEARKRCFVLLPTKGTTTAVQQSGTVCLLRKFLITIRHQQHSSAANKKKNNTFIRLQHQHIAKDFISVSIVVNYRFKKCHLTIHKTDLIYRKLISLVILHNATYKNQNVFTLAADKDI